MTSVCIHGLHMPGSSKMFLSSWRWWSLQHGRSGSSGTTECSTMVKSTSTFGLGILRTSVYFSPFVSRTILDQPSVSGLMHIVNNVVSTLVTLLILSNENEVLWGPLPQFLPSKKGGNEKEKICVIAQQMNTSSIPSTPPYLQIYSLRGPL